MLQLWMQWVLRRERFILNDALLYICAWIDFVDLPWAERERLKCAFAYDSLVMSLEVTLHSWQDVRIQLLN